MAEETMTTEWTVHASVPIRRNSAGVWICPHCGGPMVVTNDGSLQCETYHRLGKYIDDELRKSIG